MRAANSPAPRSLTVTLLIVNAAVFFVMCLTYGFASGFSMPGFVFPADDPFVLNLGGEFRHFYLWQLLSFQFLHGGIVHLLLNSWVIYNFGREVEAAVGRKAFLLLYLCSGFVGGLLQLGAALVAPEFYGAAVVGASVCSFGLVAAFAALYPERPLTKVLFYIVPVSMPARYLLVAAVALALLGIAFPFGNLAHAAHLGGIFTGLAFLKYVLCGTDSGLRPRLQQQVAPPQATVTFVTARPAPRAKEADETPVELETAEFMSRRVDPILDKISTHGLHSLTVQERKVLEQARERMSKR